MTVVRVFVHNSQRVSSFKSASSESKSYAIVTGSNKGIGFEVCRQLASNGVTVALTARDEKKGIEATEKHKECGLSDYVVFHQLASSFSIASLAHCVKTIFGMLDILVNNAGISGMALGDSTGRVNNAGISGESLDWHAIEASHSNAIKVTKNGVGLCKSNIEAVTKSYMGLALMAEEAICRTIYPNRVRRVCCCLVLV